jgi:hypothetical protein
MKAKILKLLREIGRDNYTKEELQLIEAEVRNLKSRALTKKQRAFYEFYKAHTPKPTTQELMKEFGWKSSRSVTKFHILLENKGYNLRALKRKK